MMYLHDNKDVFAEIIQQARTEYGYEREITEKDYYVSMFLKEICKTDIDFVFKGGTSLSKCYQVINRFSEDIDLTVLHRPSRKQKKDIKQAIKDCADKIGLLLVNEEMTRSGRDFNRYELEYDSIFSDNKIRPVIYIEVSVAIEPFPIDVQSVNSYIEKTLNSHGLREVIEEYELQSFLINVQDIKRTAVDKVFALCDYFMQGKSERYSRHIYDLYQIDSRIGITNISKELVQSVRQERLHNPNCLSAQAQENPTNILKEIVKRKYFAADYSNITENLLYDDIVYDQAITVIQKIIDSNLFTPNH